MMKIKNMLLIIFISSLTISNVSADGDRPGFFSRLTSWFSPKKEEKIIQVPVVDKTAPTNEYVDYKMTQSVEQITNHINSVVAALEEKIEALQVETVASKKAAIKRKKLANMRKVSAKISEEVSKQLAKN